ncbi:hypothetical protein B0T26DRAFT_735038 [Lasiosphaeria miniovina]|uniref:Uncharacterized protein n=1 Tax=Lasiosphaeria miniovina TaxID=1954250 RepID=A0AA40DG67_9PEZI|nr:uncharacterized protein B0T26DRAFT_735038 [Lasiosphaeria miniovina]KAK0701870.1 hypothetical protein B0T26DRAFT_735038 [Lasiosphaeria miniovina]
MMARALDISSFSLPYTDMSLPADQEPPLVMPDPGHCSGHDYCGVPCTFEWQHVLPLSSQDTGGPGVIASFLATGWLAVALIVIYYLFAFDPKQLSRASKYAVVNPVDVAVTGLARRAIPSSWFGSRWNAFVKAILTISDVQTLMGFAAAFTAIFNLWSGISTYHFMLIVQCVWFSHVAQLTGLTIQRYHPRSATAAYTRLLFTLALTGLLVTGIVGTFFYNWAYQRHTGFTYPDYRALANIVGGSASLPGSYAVCFWNTARNIQWHQASSTFAYTFNDTPAYGSGITAIVLVVVNLAARIIRIPVLEDAITSTRQMLSKSWRSLFAGVSDNSQPSGLIQRLVLSIGLTTLFTARLLTDLLLSTLTEIYWVLIPAIWGTITLLRAHNIISPSGSEKWAYAQVLAWFVLGAVVLVTISYFFKPSATVSDLPSHNNPAEPASDEGDILEQGSSAVPAANPNPGFIDQALTFLEDDDKKSSPVWVPAALSLALFQVAAITALFFDKYSDIVPNAATGLALFVAVPLLVGVPVSSYVFILSCVALQRNQSSGGAKQPWVVASGAIVGSGLLYLLVPQVSWNGLQIAGLVFIGVGGAIVLVNLAALVVVLAGRRRYGPISLGN